MDDERIDSGQAITGHGVSANPLRRWVFDLQVVEVAAILAVVAMLLLS